MGNTAHNKLEIYDVLVARKKSTISKSMGY